ncbi:InlB B-repeat-containing protein, partial [Listeria seeligeri]|uniref:InlB B-repeat-containing protein n=1 Tax=Listeria seeligeri TaxID=1640 RepID=UPI0022EB6018
STNTMPANDITLYAQFSINSYNARLDIDGKTTTQSVVYQEHLAEPTAPTKEGYTFTGWYDEKTGGNKWDFSTNTMPANDITLYAQFNKNKGTDGGNDTPGQDTNNRPDNSNSQTKSKSVQVHEQVDSASKILPTTGDETSILVILIGILCIGFSIHVFRQTYSGSEQA